MRPSCVLVETRDTLGASSARGRAACSLALVLVVLLAAACGERARSGQRSERSEPSTQAYRSIGLGVRASPRPAVRCLTGAYGATSANRSYAAVVRTVTRAYALPRAGRIVGRFAHIDQNGFPSVFGVVGVHVDRTCTPTWYRLQLPLIPNGTTGWVHAGAVRVYPVTSRIVVDLSERRLVAYRNGAPVLRTHVAIGAAQTPTPTGRFFVDERFVLSDPNGPFGVAALGISAHSTVLHDWAQGGPIALHGTNEPSAIGEAVSHGCVRLANGDMRRLLALAPAGTPVLIRP